MLHTSYNLLVGQGPCDRILIVREWLTDHDEDGLFPIVDLLGVHGLAVPDDAIWALCATPEGEAADRDRVARLFVADCTARALERERAAGREPDPRSWAAVEVARRYAHGNASDSELDDVRVAANDAWVAAETVARAAETAARETARDAAAGAAWATVRTAWAAVEWSPVWVAGAAAKAVTRPAWAAARSVAWAVHTSVDAGASERAWLAQRLRELCRRSAGAPRLPEEAHP